MALSIPIIAILTKGRTSKKETQKIYKEIEALRVENLQLKQRLENIETIVTEPDYDINKTLKAPNESKHRLLD
ncbi:hypothetical protein [Flammeovirga sp. SJP92]|uniref:hypothetical protein n=1 Tax=Flammeovirga sp. SJP92 TaxID=1775430 RepID=UPI0012FCB2B6|nr:hypothetical protein [Flammeovirga sp. SJP92]